MAGTGWDPAGVDASVTISEGGQKATRSSGGNYNSCAVRGLAGRSRGRRYFEITPNTGSYASFVSVGFMDAGASLGPFYQLGAGNEIQGGWRPASGQFYYSYPSGDKGARDSGPQYSAGVLGVLIDFDTKQCFIYLDGVLRVTEAMNIPNDAVLFPACALYSTSSVSTSATLQTVEPFQYPPEVTFMAWDISDSALISRVAGLMKIEGAPVRRTLKAFSFERMTYQLDGFSITESKPLGQTLSGENGEYQIILRDGFPREVFVVAFDDYGEAFTPGLAVTPGYRLHPTEPNGHIYECDGSGVLPETEPTWVIDTENSQLIGTASFATFPFYRPEVNGPLMPEISMGGHDPHWDKVVSLLSFDEGFSDEVSGNIWSVTGSGVTTTETISVFGRALRSEGLGGSTLGINDVSPLRVLAGQDFTLELFAYIDPTSNRRQIINTYTGSAGSNLMIQESAGLLSVYNENQLSIATGLPFSRGQWHHVALVRESGVLTPFVDGVKGTGWTYSGPYNFNTFRFLVWTYGNIAVAGGIDEFRFTKGVARYTEDFTPPTEPFPNFGPAAV